MAKGQRSNRKKALRTARRDKVRRCFLRRAASISTPRPLHAPAAAAAGTSQMEVTTREPLAGLSGNMSTPARRFAHELLPGRR